MLTYPVMDDFSRYVREHPDLLPRYVEVLEQILDEQAGHELDTDIQEVESPLWSLFNAGFMQSIDPTSDEGRRARPLYGPCLRKIDTVLRTSRGDAPLLISTGSGAELPNTG